MTVKRASLLLEYLNDRYTELGSPVTDKHWREELMKISATTYRADGSSEREYAAACAIADGILYGNWPWAFNNKGQFIKLENATPSA